MTMRLLPDPCEVLEYLLSVTVTAKANIGNLSCIHRSAALT